MGGNPIEIFQIELLRFEVFAHFHDVIIPTSNLKNK